MSSLPDRDLTNFEKANAAARDSMHSVLEIARRTNTPIIVYRNGQIERLSPDDFPQEVEFRGHVENVEALNDD